jgi:hypothetical protein
LIPEWQVGHFLPQFNGRNGGTGIHNASIKSGNDAGLGLDDFGGFPVDSVSFFAFSALSVAPGSLTSRVLIAPSNCEADSILGYPPIQYGKTWPTPWPITSLLPSSRRGKKGTENALQPRSGRAHLGPGNQGIKRNSELFCKIVGGVLPSLGGEFRIKNRISRWHEPTKVGASLLPRADDFRFNATRGLEKARLGRGAVVLLIRRGWTCRATALTTGRQDA